MARTPYGNARLTLSYEEIHSLLNALEKAEPHLMDCERCDFNVLRLKALGALDRSLCLS